jgi:hypothetical protein
MPSTINTNIIDLLGCISKQLNRYVAFIIFIFGVMGNILNCLVLSQRTLRSNTCALLFLASSFIDLISILVGLTFRILSGWELDPTTTISSICKFRAFVVFSTRTAAIWLITLATIDRWLLSSVDIHRRQISSLKNVKRGIIIVVILSILSYIQMLYCYEANITDAPLKCYGKSEICRLATDLIYILITIAIPLILMVRFGLLTISNVYDVRSRMASTTTISINIPSQTEPSQLRRTDTRLLRMLLVQILLLIILCVPQALQKLYITLRPFGSGSELEDAINTFLYNIDILLAFIASGMPFYIYTLAGGSIFRNASMNLIQTVVRKITY